VQLLAHVLADTVLRTLAACANALVFRDFMFDALARQVRWQGFAPALLRHRWRGLGQARIGQCHGLRLRLGPHEALRLSSCAAALAGLTEGPVFRGIDQWGHVSEDGLHINSLVPLLRSLFTGAGIVFAEQYSGHSLRRGFAQWATLNGWDIKTLMEYIGWKNVQSALRYVDGADPFARHRVSCARPAIGEITGV
jgi:integrase